MGFWGYHPMEGDAPLDDKGAVEFWLTKTLIEDIKTEEQSGKNENISDDLRNFVIERNYDKEKIFEDFYMDEYKFERDRDLWNTYKYDLIHQFKDEVTEYEENTYFVIPFRFIEMDIHVKSKYIPYLIEMLGDGGSKTREYRTFKDDNSKYTLEDFKENHEHPLYYVLLVEKYAVQLFDESNDELNDEFVINHPEIRDVVSKGLFESVFQIMEETNEIPFMNVK